MKTKRAFLALQLIATSPVVTAQQAIPGNTPQPPHFEIAEASDYVPTNVVQHFDEIYAVVVERLGVSLDETIRLLFAPTNPGPCRTRGSTMVPPPASETDQPPVIWIFADQNTDRRQISAAWAHELGHAVQYFAIDGGQSIASIYVEGFATWAAGPYWLGWQGADSFRSLVASYIAAGTYLPLHENDGFLDRSVKRPPRDSATTA